MRPDLPISASSVQLLVKIGAERGLTADDCLRGSGLTPEALRDPFAEVTIGQEYAVMRALIAHVDHEPGVGIDCGRRYHLAMHGNWGLLMATANDLREALTIALQYVELAWAFTTVRFRGDSDGAALIIEDTEIPGEVRVYLVERIAAAIKVMLSELVGTDVPLTEVTFRHAQPADISRHRDVLGLNPTFAAAENSVGFDPALLDRPLPQGNEWARSGYERLCLDLLNARRARVGMAGTVRQLLVRQSGRIPDSHEVARELGLSTRTLLRRLQGEGTSYRKLVDEVRLSIAEELLGRTMLTNEQIATRLGYTEAANFARAFKRWSGMTPQEFRIAKSGMPV